MVEQKFDTIRVNVAIKIALAILRTKQKAKLDQLYKDLARIQESMTQAEYDEYIKRTA